MSFKNFSDTSEMLKVKKIKVKIQPVKKIREKIEEDAAKPQYIETIWGKGYRFKV